MCPDVYADGANNEGAAGFPPDLRDVDHPKTADPSKEQVIGERNLSSLEQKLLKTDEIPKKMKDLKRVLQEKVGYGTSFDVTLREMVFGGRRCAIFYMNGFAKDVALIEIIKRLTYADEASLEGHALQAFQDKLVAHIQVTRLETMDEVIDKVLAGMTALFIEHEDAALVIDAKNYPVRNTQEPDLERVVRGSRDGFVETLLTNVTLIRRRLRDPRLKFEIIQVGERTKSDVCIAYVNDIADPVLVDTFRQKIQNVKIDGLPMAEKQLEEAVIKKGWNPYPMVRYSERPDVVAAHMLEGHIVLLADTSPSAMILPATFFQLVQHADEYRQTPGVGTYMRWVRYFGILVSMLVLPLWYLMVIHPELKPAGLEWIGPQEHGHLPILLQFLFAEIGVDLMRIAAVHTPAPLATATGLIAAVLIGEIAVKTGIFVNEVILYMAVATIGLLVTPSYELSMANRLSRLALLVVTALFSVPGFVGGVTVWILFLALQRSYNTPYMWPFIPFNAKALMSIALRRPFISNKVRPSVTKPQDSTRQPS